MAPNEDIVEGRDPEAQPAAALPAEGDRAPPRVVAPALATLAFRGVPVVEIVVVEAMEAAPAVAASVAVLGVVDEREEADCFGPFPPADAACKV